MKRSENTHTVHVDTHFQNLRNAESALNSFNATGVAIVALNKKLEITFFTENIKEVLDISSTQLGKHIKDITAYFKDCDVCYYAEKTLENHTVYKGKITTYNKRHFIKKMAPLFDQQNEASGVLLSFFDITELENAQRALILSENRFYDMTAIAVDYFFELSKDGTIVYVSPSVKDSLGYSQQEVLGRNISEFIPSDEYPYVVKHTIKHIKQHGTYPPITHHVIKKDGSIIVVEAKGKVIYNKKGEIIGYRAINRNITEQISAEKEREHLNHLLEQKVAERTKELEEKQHQLEEAQRIGKVGSWMWEVKENKLTWSDMSFNIFGITKEKSEISFEDFKNKIHPEDVEKVFNIDKECIAKNIDNYQIEYRIIRPNGEIAYINATGHITKDKQGEAIITMGTVQDITSLKQQEEERNKMIADLMKQNRELQQFNYIVSHNFRSQVGNIIGFSKLYQKEKGQKRNNEIIENIIDSAQNLDMVIHDLNQIAQLKTGITEGYESINLKELINSVLKMLHPQIQKVNADIRINLNGLKTIHSIKSYVHSIFFNLISNALKYRNPAKQCQIKIDCNHTDKYISFSVEDNGLGFDFNKKKDKIFGLYKRFHSGIEGRGMGLYLVKLQAETLGGYVDVKSELGKGARFTIYIANNSQT